MTHRYLLLVSTLVLGCSSAAATPSPESGHDGVASDPKTRALAEPKPAAATPAAHSPAGAQSPAAAGQAEVGKPAPDFTLTDYEGKAYHLADLRGKTVVLEWFNPDCPFVKASHTKGSLKGLAKRWTDKGVVWLAIDSSAPGKQGNLPDAVAAGKKAYAMEHPVLADASGQVGRLYGATNTPHLFVINAQGVVAYRGAIDNSPDGEGESPTGGTLINYVDVALQALAAGKPVETKETRAYGCGVKYGS
jgi:peroxiredoxin